MRNQTSFRLTTTLLPTDTSAKTTDVINKVDSCGCKFKPTFTEETVVLTNDDRTIMETTKAYSCNGALCFTKRGLSDDDSETQVANRKLTWNPGTLAFVTAGAGDWIDKDDDVTWTGNQTYTGTLTSTCTATYCGQLITKKGVKYPNFTDVTALEAYADPFAGMFATVDSTGELYRYNAKTCCWDMVSTAALGTYTIVSDTCAPAPGTADTVITFVPNECQIYLGEGLVADHKPYYQADVLVVGGGGAGGGYYGGGGGGGAVVECQNYKFIAGNSCVKVGAGGAYDSGTNKGLDGGYSKFGTLTAGGGKGGCVSCGSGGAAGNYYGGGASASTAGGGGGGAGAPGNNTGNSCSPRELSSTLSMGGAHGGAGGIGVMSNIDGKGCGYGGGGAGGSYCNQQSHAFCGGGSGGYCNCSSGCKFEACPGNYYGGGGGGGVACSTYGGKVGCQGVVIVRYPSDGSYGINCATGGTVATCTIDGVEYKIHTFTSDGTFCVVS